MKWFFGLVISGLLFVQSVVAQPNPQRITLHSASSAASATGNVLEAQGYGSVMVQTVTAGSWDGTITYNVSVDGTNFTPVSCKPVASTTLTTTTTTDAVVVCPIAGARQFKAPITDRTTGSVTVTAIMLFQTSGSGGPGGGGGSGDALTTDPLSQFAATTSAQLAGVISNETGSGVLVFGTSPSFTTDIRTPLVIGSTASGGDLTLQSTNHATKGTIFFGTGGTTVYDEVNNRLGIGTASPLVKFQVTEGPNVTSAAHILYSQDNDYLGGAGAAVGLNLQTYYTARNTGSPFNPTHAITFSKLYYGLKNDQATLESTAIGTTTNEGLHTVVYAQGDQESEYTALYAGVRFNIGTGYSSGGSFAGNTLGQTAGPAGGLFGIADFNVKGPIAVQPGLLNVMVGYINNYYNGQPSRGSQESGAYWALTGFSHGGENDALHAAATTYPIAIGFGCAGTSGSAVPGAGRGFETCFRSGGKAGPWGGTGVLETSIIGVGFESRDYNLYGAYFHDAIGSAAAIYVTSTGGNSGFGTTADSVVRLQASLTSNTNGAAGLKGIINQTTAAAGTIQVGVYGTSTAAHTSGSHGRQYGILGQGFHTQGGTSAWIVGGAFEAATSGSGGTITDLVSTLVLANTVGGSTTVTRNQGLHIAAQTGGSEVFQLRSVGTAKSYFAGMVQVDMPAAQTITGGDTVTADACSTVKRITSAGAVTTNTTNTFTAPASTNSGCKMSVCNVGANNITLDNNANFKSVGGLDVVLTPDDCVEVSSTGASGAWYQTGVLVAN